MIPFKTRYFIGSFLKHDLKSSITVTFVALPLCLGVALASGTPVSSGLVAGVVGGILVGIISNSPLSVSGPAAGLTAISSVYYANLGPEAFFVSVALSGIFQIVLGILRLGKFTHFIPGAVIKGMLAAIGFLLLIKQLPTLVGSTKPDFWSKELFNILTFDHVYMNTKDLLNLFAAGPVIISILGFVILFTWKKYFGLKFPYIPASFLIVVSGILAGYVLNFFPSLALTREHFVEIPAALFNPVNTTSLSLIFSSPEVIKVALVICFVASLESLLSLAAIDKLDPLKRISPPNRELIAQGSGNLISGIFSGIPVTAVIVRSSANAEAGARTKLSAIFHGIWLLIFVLLAPSLIRKIPYSSLAVILFRTGYNLAKPSLFGQVFRQGREQFVPFIFTIAAILITDLLTGVIIGLIYSVYFLVKHTYRAGFTLQKTYQGHMEKYQVDLALNVSFLNKKRIKEMLDKIPPYSIVEINGTESVYIDNDILEIIQEFRSKAQLKHIQLTTLGIAEVEIISVH